MSKISIVLSVILVVSGISASNAEDDSNKVSYLDACKESIELVRTYLTNLYDGMLYTVNIAAVRKRQSKVLDKIEKDLPSELNESDVLHDQKMPSGEHIKCNYEDAKRLLDLMRFANRIAKAEQEY